VVGRRKLIVNSGGVTVLIPGQALDAVTDAD
jgi:hypothetical protein